MPSLAFIIKSRICFRSGVSAQSASTVYGTMVAKEIWVLDDVHAAWADYVFKKDYKLMPLNEVEKYYKTNNHLPEVPSEKEVKEKGLNVGDISVTLLKKIEELTLYMVEQQKQINELKNKK